MDDDTLTSTPPQTLRCVLLGCKYNYKEECKRCGRTNPDLIEAKRAWAERQDVEPVDDLWAFCSEDDGGTSDA